jgi:hypothetical protein
VSRGQMSQPPFDPITRDSVPHRGTDHEADTRPVSQLPIIEMRSMNHQGGPSYAYATPGRPPKLLRAAHS